MEWDRVIERNREALKRVLAALVAMAGLGAAPSSPLVGFEAGLRRRREVVVPVARQQAEKAGTLPEAAGTRQEDGSARRGDLSAEAQRAKAEAEPPAEPGEGCFSSGRPTLPRHLHRAVLRLLRPAESAARRLVIVAARDLVVPPPAPPRPRKPDPRAGHAALRALGIAVVMSPADHARAAAARRAADMRAARAGRSPVLPLFDPPQYPFRVRLRTVPPHRAPRILSFGDETPHRLPPPPAPDDPVDARRLALRLQALASALDDLPGHARRFARWRARRDAAGAQTKNNAAGAQNLAPSLPSTGRVPRPRVLPPASPRRGSTRRVGCTRRISPLRPGRPPGLSRATRRKPTHEIHEVLADLQYFARKALEAPDTS